MSAIDEKPSHLSTKLTIENSKSTVNTENTEHRNMKNVFLYFYALNDEEKKIVEELKKLHNKFVVFSLVAQYLIDSRTIAPQP